MLTKLVVKSQIAFENFKNDQRGVTAIEYAIIGVSISAIVLLMFNGTLKDALVGAMTTVSDNISTANIKE
ncbi:Flp family type IVb pilin [Aliivibrio sp. S4TY2]|uniref:Flp family type IVb pilin n=1 Tax=unclassified Aliivibrio TaxID=2645654 RepID=UPI0023792AB4|nr:MULTISPECIES: Flp family type IVb pilin [unclassified Aliivibrio]MDD9158206.1 Flp family type IVb pilin [Aliivibrio sp. S4TY2]MDD9162121.1 Flp family type IVb pilin [Aliivibrio sp. S4TY1]MDD9166159.1 Flp family type IVb pilin [Aliivibrio sp. S4MY2]MDD9170157.1 Flp family type IVb pilin [Aliivibrio sp. S4MY4]MDD9187198.1 Flp family type IVb pilin [Aliivibrio sp. S4MY3]